MWYPFAYTPLTGSALNLADEFVMSLHSSDWLFATIFNPLTRIIWLDPGQATFIMSSLPGSLSSDFSQCQIHTSALGALVTICYWILQRGDDIRVIYVETTKRNADENQRIKALWFADLSIRVSTFRICYANAADHVTKSDLKSQSKIAAVIMKWLSQGIPFICGNVGTYKHFWILRSSHI